jgi:hypothetical protein
LTRGGSKRNFEIPQWGKPASMLALRVGAVKISSDDDLKLHLDFHALLLLLWLCAGESMRESGR